MQRWQEQVEIKHAEFMRCISAYKTMHGIWTSLADQPSNPPGYDAYAKQKAAMFLRMKNECEATFAACGRPALRDVMKGETLAERVAAFRCEDNDWITEFVSGSAFALNYL